MDRLDHKSFLAGLSPEDRVRLTQTEDAAGLKHLALHLGLIVGFAVWVLAGWMLWPLALVALGVSITFLFMLEHECTHKTPFATPWMNEAAGHLAGFLIGIPFTWFRAFHMAHHKHTNDPDLDPELAGPRPRTKAQLFWYLTGYPYWRDKVKTLFRSAFGELNDPFLTPRLHPKVRREARIMLALYASLLLTIPFLGATLFWIWLLPLIIGFPFLRIFLLAEHDGCPMVPDMFDNTRTTLTNRIVRWLAWSMPYHAEHHAWPQVPFHKLEELHRLTKPHLKHVEAGYLTHFGAKAQSLGTGSSNTQHP